MFDMGRITGLLTQMHGQQAPAAAAAKAGDARAFSMERSAAAGAGAVADALAASWSADGASAVAAGDEGAWAIADDVKIDQGELVSVIKRIAPQLSDTAHSRSAGVQLVSI